MPLLIDCLQRKNHMRPEDKPALYALVADALGYYRQNASEFTLQIWWQACQRYDIEQVSKAMTAHAMDPDRGQFAPKVADIVRILSGTTTDRAQLAWGRVLEAAAQIGAYTDVAFDDPAIHATVEDLGGWTKICRTETKDLSYLQHRFCESYRAYSGRETFGYPAVLGGDRSPDAMHAKRGLPVPKPRLIGNPQRAQQVMALGGASKSAIGGESVAEIALHQITRLIDHSDKEAA